MFMVTCNWGQHERNNLLFMHPHSKVSAGPVAMEDGLT